MPVPWTSAMVSQTGALVNAELRGVTGATSKSALLTSVSSATG